MNKEEISKMTIEEQIRQLEWSDKHEFSYWYAYYLLDYINQLETNRDEAIKFIDNNMYESYCYVGSEDKLKEILERGKE